MNSRTRLSVLSLEARDNPSGPDLIDPYTLAGTTSVATAEPVNTTVINIAIAVATGGTTTTTNSNALVDTNSLTHTSMIP